MVAISLYRGNLHRVPDVPRRYGMPPPKLSLKDFKILLRRRNAALSHLHSSSSSSAAAAAAAAATSSNPNPNPKTEYPNHIDNNDRIPHQVSPLEVANNNNNNNDNIINNVKVEEIELEVQVKKELDGGDCSGKVVDNNGGEIQAQAPLQAQAVNVEEKPLHPENPSAETTDRVDVVNQREKRKSDVEEELEVLNAKKHKLVLVLKQILNAEEELKRRNSMQGTAIRPSAPFQADATNDLGSPSSESPLRRLQHNVVPHPSRATLGVSSSPSRFAPPGHQGHSGFPPTVSVSGTNYIASSPSPAASGGTPAFRDARQPSPWN